MEAEAFAAACRHDDEGVAMVDAAVYGARLQGTKGVEAPVLAEEVGVVEVGGGHGEC